MTPKRKRLGERHKKILQFIKLYIEREGYPPTLQEIGDACDITSSATVSYYLDQLEKMGKIERQRKIARSVRLTESFSLGEMIKIPIAGRIVAGEPIPVPASDFNYFDSDTSIELPRKLFPNVSETIELFALEVDGDSMVDALVGDGDYVIMEPVFSNTEVDDGDMVAVWLPSQDEITLKYFYEYESHYSLQPANPTMAPIIIDKSEPVEIKGKVVFSFNAHADRKKKNLARKTDIEANSSKFILWNVYEPNITLSPTYLLEKIAPYLKAIENLQIFIAEIQDNSYKDDVRIRKITQNSPPETIIEGATQATRLIMETIVPWRYQHAKTMAELVEKEKGIKIKLDEAVVNEKRSQRIPEGVERERITAETKKLNEEAEKLRLENEELRLKIEKEKVALTLEVIAKFGQHLSEKESSKLIEKIIPTITVLITSEVELKEIS